MKSIILKKGILPLAVLALAAVSFWLGRQGAVPAAAPAGTEDVTWTCPMHPQVQLPEKVPCPICKMELVPMEPGGGGGERELVLTEAAKKLAEIETTPAELRFVTRRVRMRGRVDFDETRLATISAYVAGRIDKLHVNYTGLPVQKGGPLALLYSPELYTAQEELLEAKRQLAQAGGESAFLRASSRRTLESAREKLRLLGLQPAQVEEIERAGLARERILVKAPLAGIVIRKRVKEGDYVRTGQELFEIADLSRLWVRLDAYEDDLVWLRYGQSVTITARAWPGETFGGRISFIDPVLDDATRTVKVRVVVENARGRLKPGMFVRGVVASRLARDGRVTAPELAGKWISPAHPEVIRDEPGDCPVCGVPLVRAADLGYLEGSEEEARPLVVPATAVLRTGVRSLVYVAKPDATEPTYEGREIRVGPRAGDWWIVRSGLEAGERVVVRGNFKIDSAMQLQGRPSMMSAPAEKGPPAPRVEVDQAFRKALGGVLGAYFDLWLTLAGDDLEGARESAALVRERLEEVDEGALRFMDRPDWRRGRRSLERFAGEIEGAKSLEAARTAFAPLSDAATRVVTLFGTGGRAFLYRVHCPMAFDDRGAWWLQSNDKIRNPYFGAAMLQCGTVETTFAGGKEKERDG